MGVVYKAREQDLNRVVALKMVRAGSQASPEDLARFQSEAEAVAALSHLNIVQIYHVGEHDGQPFFTLEYCSGGSLADQLERNPLPARQAAELMERVARGVAFAHLNGIIHRDLKPGNVLLQSDGIPKVTDFGLAKKVESTDDLTQTGAVLGTPSYMSPEQAEGQGKRVGPAADVYALGAILYKCLTGRPPFQAASPMDTMIQVLERDPAPPRLLNPSVPYELEVICLKCLEKRPENRYPSADAVADDLRRYLNGESIHARGYNVISRLARTLEHSRHEEEFGDWGNMLIWFAGLIVSMYGLMYVLMRQGPAFDWVAISIQYLFFLCVAVVFWIYRQGRLLPTTPAERQLWSIVIGFVIACFTLRWAVRQFYVSEPILIDPRFLYPLWCTLSGLAFFAMAGGYFGRFYLIGLAFFVLALLLPHAPDLGPLGFGLLWGLALLILGRRFRRASNQHHLAAFDQDQNKPT